MRQKTLCQLFGITPAVCSRLLDVGLRGLESAANRIPECQILWPTAMRMAHCAAIIHAKVPGLSAHSVFGFVDGLNLAIDNPSDPLEQNAYYNGWLKGVACSQVLVFDPKGLIIWVRYNCPGSWHDVTVATPLIQHMATVPDPFCLLGDTGFQCGEEMRKKILMPLKGGTRLPADAAERERVQRLSADITTGRQAAEWGMRALQGAYARLKSCMTADPLQLHSTPRRQRRDPLQLHSSLRRQRREGAERSLLGGGGGGGLLRGGRNGGSGRDDACEERHEHCLLLAAV
jgi:hypothetical protein